MKRTPTMKHLVLLLSSFLIASLRSLLRSSTRFAVLAVSLCSGLVSSLAAQRPNVLFIISDDLTSTALGCYGNKVCQTPNIDRLAARGMRFTRAHCQGTYCGPSRASFISGYYPHATVCRATSARGAMIGDRATWAQHFKNAGYYSARVSKIFHMGVPGGIEDGTDGADDPASWTERFNSQGPEWKAPGIGETLEKQSRRQKARHGRQHLRHRRRRWR
jgi:iduronate 2-sulfatase